MDQEKIVGELAQLFRLHFHGTDKEKFYSAIRKLWAMSGLDIDFFFPQALPWLMELARVHSLPDFLIQCLVKFLRAVEFDTDEKICVGIKQARFVEGFCHGTNLCQWYKEV